MSKGDADESVRFCTLILFESHAEKFPVQFPIHLKVMPGNPLYAFAKIFFKSYAGNAYTLSLIRELCRYIPVCFHLNSFESHAGKARTLSFFSKVIPGDSL